MNNDLISREALKEIWNLYKKYQPHLATNVYEFGVALKDLIDNIPAVEPFEPDYVGSERLQARQRGYEEGYHYGMAIGKTLNPKIKQGEWIYHGLENCLWGQMECSFCHRRSNSDADFCQYCGASMKGAIKDD